MSTSLPARLRLTENIQPELRALFTLTASLALLSHPERWAKDAFGLDPDGAAVHDNELVPDNVCGLCTIGALLSTTKWSFMPDNPTGYLSTSHPLLCAYNQARTHIKDVVGVGVATWNDHPCTTHSQLVESFASAVVNEADAVREAGVPRDQVNHAMKAAKVWAARLHQHMPRPLEAA